MKISVTLSSRERKLLRMLLMVILPPLFVLGAALLFVLTLPLHILYAVRASGILPKPASSRRSFARVTRKPMISGKSLRPGEFTSQDVDVQIARVPQSAPSV